MKALRLCALIAVLAAPGCALEKVQPWEREFLARPEMGWDPGLVEESGIRSHTFVSKEAASGGAAVGGGGCGCN